MSFREHAHLGELELMTQRVARLELSEFISGIFTF